MRFTLPRFPLNFTSHVSDSVETAIYQYNRLFHDFHNKQSQRTLMYFSATIKQSTLFQSIYHSSAIVETIIIT